jgi:hypothetical protein
MDYPATLVERIGTRLSLRMYWGNDCPNAYGQGNIGGHNAEVRLEDVVGQEINEWIDHSLYADHTWATKCDHCDALVTEEGQKNRQVNRQPLWNTESGRLEPGCIHWNKWHHEEEVKHHCPWDNCNDTRGHRHIMLPNRHTWDIDSRARNCTMPDDRTHRCWVVHGETPNLHVDKNGYTCNAGAGSIQAGDGPNDYHGFLDHGIVTETRK